MGSRIPLLLYVGDKGYCLCDPSEKSLHVFQINSLPTDTKMVFSIYFLSYQTFAFESLLCGSIGCGIAA